MQHQRLTPYSVHLGRRFHVNLYTPPRGARLLVLMLGGSGKTRQVYEQRFHTEPEKLSAAAAALEHELAFCFCFVTAPYDVRFDRLESDLELRERWNHHLEDELLPLLPELPFYILGYSGGAALGLSGLQHHPRCVGAGALGADGLSEELEIKPAWEMTDNRVTLYYNRGDRVLTRQWRLIEELEQAQIVRCLVQKPGGHGIEHYIANGSFAGLVRRAAALVRGG